MSSLTNKTLNSYFFIFRKRVSKTFTQPCLPFSTKIQVVLGIFPKAAMQKLYGNLTDKVPDVRPISNLNFITTVYRRNFRGKTSRKINFVGTCRLKNEVASVHLLRFFLGAVKNGGGNLRKTTEFLGVQLDAEKSDANSLKST